MFAYRTSPAWAPEHAQNYKFRTWVRDVQLWLMLTDLLQQAASIVMRSGGVAREWVRSITLRNSKMAGSLIEY